MFGLRRDKRAQAAQKAQAGRAGEAGRAGRAGRAPVSAGSAGTASSTVAMLTDAAEVSAELRRALVRVGCDFTQQGAEGADGAAVTDADTREVLLLQVEDMDAAVLLGRSPLSLVLSADWDGVLDGDAEEHRRVLNDWNARHTVPRAVAVLDVDGDARVHLDSVMDCSAGVSPAQVDEWVRRALSGLSQVTEFLDEQFPDAARVELEDAAEEPSEDADAEGGEDPDAGADADTGGSDAPDTADSTALVAGEPVTLDRIAAVVPGETVSIKENGASGRRGNGYVRTVGAAAPDIALHDGTLTVTTGAAFGDAGEVPAEALDWLRAVCGQVNTDPDGVVSVVTGDSGDSGDVIMTSALHRPVGAGMHDAQLAAVLATARAQVGTRFDGLVAEVTGGSTGGELGEVTDA